MNKEKLFTNNETDVSSPEIRPTLQENQVNTTTETINTKIHDTYLPASKTVTTNGRTNPLQNPGLVSLQGSKEANQLSHPSLQEETYDLKMIMPLSLI